MVRTMTDGQLFTDIIGCNAAWQEFLEYKTEHNNLRQSEQKRLYEFIKNKKYLEIQKEIQKRAFPGEYPTKKIINKEGTMKKRIVYSFHEEISITLKFMAFYLYRFDEYFCNNCYAFRRGYGVSNAIKKIAGNRSYRNKYCLKADISDYFNSIDTRILLEKLTFVKQRDEILYDIFYKILSCDYVMINGAAYSERHGALAGIPIAPFLANVYLSDVDKYFKENKRDYFRYSDDILIFADTYEELLLLQKELYDKLEELHLCINHEKEKISKPGEAFEFLGFSYKDGCFDLSENTKRKTKAKIKRKADALRRWQRKKGLTSDKAAIGFIKAMNRKFYGDGDEDEFTWNRWFFPNLTMDEGLKEIDGYMQEYIRYTVTGRHYKGNYKITYDRMKEWGYRSLVHEFYYFKKERACNRIHDYV